MRPPRTLLIEPQAAPRQELEQALAAAGLPVQAVEALGELPAARLVVVGPSVKRPAALVREVRRHLPHALVLAAREALVRPGWADAVLPLPVSPRELQVRLPELLRLHTLARRPSTRRERSTPSAPRAPEPLQDPLTHFYTFTHLRDVVFLEVRRSGRHGLPLVVGLAAVDALAVGARQALRSVRPRLLESLALALRLSLRDTDLAVQYTPERVLLLLAHTEPPAALGVARRICERVGRTRLLWQEQVLQPTASVGLVALRPGGEPPFAQLARQAEQALEAARAAGGSRVQLYAQERSEPAGAAEPDRLLLKGR